MDYENPWIYNGEPFTDTQADGHFGFVYLITNKITGRKYIGKKLLSMAGYKTIKGKKKKIRKPSDWKTYYGSSPSLKADIEEFGKENFAREIIKVVDNRSSASYYEAKEMFAVDAILSDDYYNDWCTIKISSIHVKAIYK